MFPQVEYISGKVYMTRLKNIKNVTRCRDSGTPKSWETRKGYDLTKQLSIQPPYRDLLP